MSETKSPALTSWVGQFAANASQEDVVNAFVGRVDDVITAQIPEIAGDPILVQDLHSSTGSQWRAFIAMLEDDYRLGLPDPAYGLALSLARRGMDLGVLLKVYRVANQAVFNFLNEIIDAAGDDAPARDEALVFIWTRAGRWMDDAVEALIETFVGERQLLYDGAIARRAEAVEALLGPTPPGATEAEKGLGHALQHWQTAGVVWSDAPDAASDDCADGRRARAWPRPRRAAAADDRRREPRSVVLGGDSARTRSRSARRTRDEAGASSGCGWLSASLSQGWPASGPATPRPGPRSPWPSELPHRRHWCATPTSSCSAWWRSSPS